MREGNVPSGIFWVVGVALMVVMALSGTVTIAQAKENDDEQYGKKEAPKGVMAGVACRAAGNQNGVFDAGDTITYPGEFNVAPGASADIDDTDGTVGTLIDGKNAKISSNKGGITVTVTGAPINVSGGDGVLNDTVCKSIVASTGISVVSAGSEGSSGNASGSSGSEEGSSSDKDGSSGSESGSSGDEGPLASILPRTGGPLLVVLGALAAVGTGLALLRHRAAGR